MKPENAGWHGLDFSPAADLNAMARLCPNGWVTLMWDGEAVLPCLFYGVTETDVEAILKDLEDNPPDVGEDCPDCRSFIGKVVYEAGQRGQDGRWEIAPSTGVELLKNERGDVVYQNCLNVCWRCEARYIPEGGEGDPEMRCTECKASQHECDDCPDLGGETCISCGRWVCETCWPNHPGETDQPCERGKPDWKEP